MPLPLNGGAGAAYVNQHPKDAARVQPGHDHVAGVHDGLQVIPPGSTTSCFTVPVLVHLHR